MNFLSLGTQAFKFGSLIKKVSPYTGRAGAVAVLIGGITSIFGIWAITIYCCLLLVVLVPIEFSFVLSESIPPCGAFEKLLLEKAKLQSLLIRGGAYAVASLPIFFGGGRIAGITVICAIIFLASGLIYAAAHFLSPASVVGVDGATSSAKGMLGTITGAVKGAVKGGGSSSSAPAGTSRV
eukprot:tig00020911_g15714.t1